ncbi:MAG: hypothetical protein JSV46_00650, partial [Candidatus Aminicenantes bacterium]
MSLDYLRETEEFKNLLLAIKQGDKGLKTTGLIDSAKAYFLSLLALNSRKRIIFIQPHSSSISQMDEQCRFYLSQYSS